MFTDIDELAAGGVIGFREALEAALIVGILVALLQRTGRAAMVSWVWGGVAAALVASLVSWKAFFLVTGEFSKDHEELFEGILYLVAAALITTVVLHIFGHDTRRMLERKAEAAIARREALGMGLLAFVSVWREGVETVIFLGAGTQSDDAKTGALVGIVLACGIGWLIFSSTRKINLKLLFDGSTVFLVLFAAFLVSKAMHEFGEIGLLPESTLLSGAVVVAYFGITHVVSSRYGVSLVAAFTGLLSGLKPGGNSS
jgi:high-affinity iron transporter